MTDVVINWVWIPAAGSVEEQEFWTTTQPGSSGEGGAKAGGCFIATACYGSSQAPQVQLLRAFRDHYLEPRLLGRVFISTYYAVSPRIARFLKVHKRLCFCTRTFVMTPILIGVERSKRFWFSSWHPPDEEFRFFNKHASDNGDERDKIQPNVSPGQHVKGSPLVPKER